MMNTIRDIYERDRRIIIPTAFAGLFLLIAVFVDIPLYRSGRDAGLKLTSEGKRLAEVISLAGEYMTLKNEVDDIRDGAFSGDGSALTGIETAVARAGMKKKLASIKPTTTGVAADLNRLRAELSIEKASLSEISRLLSTLESGRQVIKVEKLSLKANYDNPSLFNASVIVNAIERG